jgi:predicted O-methyltransferase YrrM
MVELLSPQLRGFLDELVPPRSAELQAMEAYARETGFPIVGPVAGHLCYQIARLIGAKRVFELGSGYGYSTAWFARAVQENGGGQVHHAVWTQELSQRARRHLDALGFGGIVQYHVSEAVQALKETPGPFDLIFNDIEKQDYADALHVIAQKLRPGGVLIVDNMLWYGRIFDQSDRSPATQGVRELTRRITADPDWIVSILPVHDGLMVALKK